jgi:hypothetical protein
VEVGKYIDFSLESILREVGENKTGKRGSIYHSELEVHLH